MTNVSVAGQGKGASVSPTGCSQAEPEDVSALRASPPRAIDIAELKADSIYAVDDPECCYIISDAGELMDWQFDGPGFVRHVGLVREVADLWLVKIPTVFDDDGWAEETELRYFKTEADARQAYAIAMEAACGGDGETRLHAKHDSAGGNAASPKTSSTHGEDRG